MAKTFKEPVNHVIDGYRFLMTKGFDGAARVCLTHSYPIKTVASGSAIWDGTQDEYEFIQAYLDAIEYNLYDRLIQLCDGLTMPTGYCLIEKRMVDVALRYGINEHSISKWRAFLEVKEEFDRLSQSTVCEKSELNWPRYIGPRHVAAAAGLFVTENAANMFGRRNGKVRSAVSDQHTQSPRVGAYEPKG